MAFPQATGNRKYSNFMLDPAYDSGLILFWTLFYRANPRLPCSLTIPTNHRRQFISSKPSCRDSSLEMPAGQHHMKLPAGGLLAVPKGIGTGQCRSIPAANFKPRPDSLRHPGRALTAGGHTNLPQGKPPRARHSAFGAVKVFVSKTPKNVFNTSAHVTPKEKPFT